MNTLISSLTLAAGLAFTPGADAPEAGPPVLSVTLTPEWESGVVDRLDVRMVLPEPSVEANAALLRAPIMLVGVPTAAYEAGDITARDAVGPLALTAEDEDPTSSGQYRRFLTERATEGDVIVEYGTAPREITPRTANGPLFDMRRQQGGLMGAGVYFYAIPANDTVYTIDLDWDLSDMPVGARGIWSAGEGAQTMTGPASLLPFSYYAAGLVDSLPEDSAEEDFALYWFAEPPFDMEAVAGHTRELYGYMSEFFNDAGAPYRIFVRENLHPGSGGTGLAQSFMFSYDHSGDRDEHGVEQLLAHEMAHNWPRLNSDPHPLTAWYTEGTAEYYSLVLSARAGMMEFDTFLEAINDRARGYYANPHLTLSNAEAGEIFWQDSLAQRVPYGRGLMYLIQVDARMREASGGARGVDALVLEVLERQRAGETIDLDAWEAMIVRELGEPGREEFLAMTRGEVIIPPQNSFGPCIRPTPTRHPAFELGYDRLSLGEVKNLNPDSNAARAGLQNGDAIIESTPERTLREDPEALMRMVVERDGERFEVEYLPRGGTVEGWGFEAVDGVDPEACGL